MTRKATFSHTLISCDKGVVGYRLVEVVANKDCGMWSHRDGFSGVVWSSLVWWGWGGTVMSIHVLCERESGCRGKWVAFPDRTSRAGSVGGRGLQRLGRVVTSGLSELPGGHRSGLVGLGWDGGEYTCIVCERVGLSGQVGCVPRPYLTCWKCGRSWSSEIGSRSHIGTVRTPRRTPVWSGGVGVGRW